MDGGYHDEYDARPLRGKGPPVVASVAYPAAPAPSYNQAAVDAILNEQNAHAVDFDEVDRRNLRHAERAGYGGGGLRESVHRGQREGIRAPERARPPRDDSDDDSFYGDDRRGGRGGRGQAEEIQRDWERERRRKKRRAAKRRARERDGRDRERRRGGRHRTRVRQIQEDAEYESEGSNDSMRQERGDTSPTSREDSLRTETISGDSDDMSVQSFSTVGSMRSARSSRSHRSSRSQQPPGILRGANRDRDRRRDRDDDRWERGSVSSRRSARSGRSRRSGAGSRSRRHRGHDEASMREDVRRDVRRRAREIDAERLREDEGGGGGSSRTKGRKSRQKGGPRREREGGGSRAKGRSSTSTTPGAWSAPLNTQAPSSSESSDLDRFVFAQGRREDLNPRALRASLLLPCRSVLCCRTVHHGWPAGRGCRGRGKSVVGCGDRR